MNLSSNELLHPAADELVRRALREFEPTLVSRYPLTADQIAGIAARVGVDAGELWLTPGSDIALRAICAMAAEGRARMLLLQEPNYPAWAEAAAALHLRVERVPFDVDNHAAQGQRLISRARAERQALIAVSVPNGPGGWVVDDDVLDELADIAARRRHLLVIDACYQAFDGPFGKHLQRRTADVVVVQSLSKSHGMAGARVALVAGSPECVASLSRSRLEECVSGLSLELARRLLMQSDNFAAIWDDVRAARELAIDHLDAHNIATVPSGGNFLAFSAGSEIDANRLIHELGQQGFRIKDLSAVPALRGWLRFTVADVPGTSEVVERLIAAVPLAGHARQRREHLR